METKLKIIKNVEAELLPNPDSTSFNLTKCKEGDFLEDHEITDFMKILLLKTKRAVLV